MDARPREPEEFLLATWLQTYRSPLSSGSKPFIASLVSHVKNGGWLTAKQISAYLRLVEMRCCRCGQTAMFRVGLLGWCSGHKDEAARVRRSHLASYELKKYRPGKRASIGGFDLNRHKKRATSGR